MVRTLFAVILLVLLPCSAAAQTASPPQYHYVDLGVLAGGSYSEATGINNSAQLVGYSTTASGNYHAFLYADGVMTDLGTLGGAYSYANGINASGQVVGWATNIYGYDNAFLYSGGAMTDLGTPVDFYSNAKAINDSGQIVGYTATAPGYERAFLYSEGAMTDLGTLGGSFSDANSINASGQIVGYSSTTLNYFHAFLYSEGAMTDLGTLGGSFSKAYAINDSGQVVGYSYTTSDYEHAFLYSEGAMTDLGTLGGDTSYAYAINDSGQVVGYAYTSSSAQHAFLRQDGTMYDLNDYAVDRGAVTLTSASSINDLGQIVGKDSNNHAFLLDPITETCYDFTLYYDNGAGDSYTGSVYANSGYNGYQLGYTQAVTDENGRPGYYEITAATDLGYDYTHDGQVLVTSYYNVETGQTFDSLNANLFVTPGDSYLGSESGYILQAGVQDYAFGSGGGPMVYEADAPVWTTTWLNDYGWDVQYNDQGQVAWIGYRGEGEAVFLYANGRVNLISDVFEYIDDESLHLNHAGEVIWGADDTNGNEQVYLYSGGSYSQVSLSADDNYMPQIDDAGMVYWSAWDGNTDRIYQYDHGVYTLLGDPAADNWGPWVSPNGHLAWETSVDGWDSWDLYTLYNGQPTKINGDILVWSDPLINDLGQVVWQDENDVIYIYNGGDPIPISGDQYYIDNLQLTAAGLVVWEGWESGSENGDQIYLYDINAGGEPSLISTTSDDNYDPQVNAAGQVVYVGYDGAWEQIYLFDNNAGGDPVNLSHNSAWNYNPLINALGQVAWVNDDSGQAYIYRDGAAYAITPGNDYVYDLWGLLPDGRVVWEGDYSLNLSSLGGTEPGEYAVTYHYADGDTYTGRVYTAANEAYALGYRQFAFEEESFTCGYYEITEASLGSDPGLAGQVWVDSYYDHESGWTFLDNSLFVTPGDNYLGSESGYIQQAGVPRYLFGNQEGAIYEASYLAWAFIAPYLGPLHQYAATPEINNQNQVVWAGYLDGDPYQICLYHDGLVESLDELGWNPKINNAGQMIWEGSMGGLYLYQDGSLNYLTLVYPGNYTLGEEGEVAWDIWNGSYNTYMYQDGLILLLSYSDIVLGTAQINAAGVLPLVKTDSSGWSQVYLYHHGIFDLLTDNTSSQVYYSSPQVNDNGDAAWVTYDSSTGFSDIQLYHNGGVTPISANDLHQNTNPWINAAGDVVWEADDGNDQEIFLYHNGGITPITNNDYDDTNPRFNAAGDIAYQGFDGQDTEIYLYQGGDTIQLSNNDYNDTDPRINDNAWVTWRTDTGEAYLYTGEAPDLNYYRYDFTYHFDEGDAYTGYVYARGDYGYVDGYVQYVSGEFHNPPESGSGAAYYQITGVTPGGGADVAGQVFVDSYYDVDSGNTYAAGEGKLVFTDPDLPGVAGTGYLGSETGYIMQAGVEDFLFGRADPAYLYNAQADAATQYSFTYQFGDGDSYTGTVYAPAGYQAPTVLYDENGYAGLYTLSDPVYDVDPYQMGAVFVSSYYDAESGQTFSQAGNNLFVTPGTNYLGSESGYIAQDGDAPFLFGLDPSDGVTFREADLGLAYSFTYCYDDRTTTFDGTTSWNGSLRMNASGAMVWIEKNDPYEVYLYTGSGAPFVISTTSYYHDGVQINDAGQVVWWGYPDEGGDGQIFLYDQGTVTNISNSSYWVDYYPQINNAGQVVWNGYDADDYSQIYLYDHGVTSVISTSLNYEYYPVINNSGWVAWVGEDPSGTYYLDLYKGSGTPVRLSDNLSSHYYFQTIELNDLGQVLWQGGPEVDGYPQIFLYNGSTTVQLSHNDADLIYDYAHRHLNNLGQVVLSNWGIRLYDSLTDTFADYSVADEHLQDPWINDLGQVACYSENDFDIYSRRIWLYQPGMDAIIPVSDYWQNNTTYYSAQPMLNDAGAVAWVSNSWYQPHQAAIHDFYTGYIYTAPDDPTYYVGYQAVIQDENGRLGHYEITGFNDYVADAGLFGQSVVTGYYDSETAYAFTVDQATLIVTPGTSGLGSESGSIISQDNPDYFFGRGAGGLFYEADQGGPPPTESTKYDFTFFYDSGDSYYGSVYAAADAYNILDEQTVAGVGHYQIQGVESGYSAALLGEVFVSGYYDAMSNHLYTPLDYAQGLPAGASFLESESDFIVSAGNDAFRFGNWSSDFLEADALMRFAFVYSYDSGGDYYFGQAYLSMAGAASLPTVISGHGSYQYVDLAYGFDPAFDLAVQVIYYHDADTAYDYTASNTTGLLGEETGYFNGYVDSFDFGPTSPVDLVNRYTFVYSYNSGGDYYYGQAFVTVAQAVDALLSPPSAGQYEFVDLAYGLAPADPDNPVQVAAYYDADTLHVYTAYDTTGVLGQETAWFDGYVDSFSFAPDTSVDLVNRYIFVYSYNSGGDYYYGQAFVTVAQAVDALLSPPSAGQYEFVDMAYGLAPADNPVQVTAYVDADTLHAYTAYDTTGVLGQETAWFDGYVDSFSFDPNTSMDLVNRYIFVYSYNSGGDYYYGQAYVTVAQTADALLPPPSNGQYEFVDLACGLAPADNPVQVTAYLDASAEYIYPTYGATGLLGHEYAWFMGVNGSEVHFGFDLAAE